MDENQLPHRRKMTKEQRTFVIVNISALVDREVVFMDAYEQLCERFEQKFPGERPPCRKSVTNLMEKFRETGSVNDKVRHRRKTVKTAENAELVKAFVQQNPHVSTRKGPALMARDLNVEMSRRSFQQILNETGHRPYKLREFQQLKPADYQSRLEFAHFMLEKLRVQPDFLDWFMYTDECIISMNPINNTFNMRYWATENPHYYAESQLHSPQFHVWGGIWLGGVIGPHVFEGTVTAAKYLQMMEEYVMPELRRLFSPEDMAKLVWMHDGAAPHRAHVVKAYFDQNFTDWLGYNGTFKWPPRSPDATPCDYFMWNDIREGVVKRSPQNPDQLRLAIIRSFEDLNANPLRCEKALLSVRTRCESLVTHAGGHIEPYKK